MNGLGFALDGVLDSGACQAVPRGMARAAELIRRAALAAAAGSAPKNYCLMDDLGNTLGTIPAAASRPVLGVNAPTIYMHRDLR